MVKNKILTSQINLAKDNNQNAFNFLLNTYWDDVYNFQLKRIKNESGAEDITIESFTKAFEKIHTYNDKYDATKNITYNFYDSLVCWSFLFTEIICLSCNG